MAIREALTLLKETVDNKLVIFSDSNAAVQAISSKEERGMETLECKKFLVCLLNCGRNVTFQRLSAYTSATFMEMKKKKKKKIL
jgi:ribonuclease HI